MTGAWREAASQQVQDDFDALLDTALPFARQMLEEHGRFYPYGQVITMKGASEMIGAAGSRSSKRLLESLLSSMRGERASFRAAAVVAPVRYTGTDAILVALEHEDGTVLDSFLPYRKHRLRRRLEFGDTAPEPGHQRIWIDP